MRQRSGLDACNSGASTMDYREMSRACCVLHRLEISSNVLRLGSGAGVRLVGADTDDDLTTLAV